MRRFLAALACVAALASVDASAQVFFNYGGVHPVNPVAGGGFCYTSGAHNHPYPVDPNIAYLYRNYNGFFYFVGDPYYFGYQGQAFQYYGHHPLNDLASYCYLDGAHNHHFLPPPGDVSYYLVSNGAYYYQGPQPPLYFTYYNTFYRRAHSYWYLPTYRRYYRTYRSVWRRYYTPASVTYITQRPVITYRYQTPPPARRVVFTRTVTRPVYRYNYTRPSTYNGYYRRPVTRTTTTRVTPSGTVIRRTTTWRRR